MSDLEQRINNLRDELDRVESVDAQVLWQRIDQQRHRSRRSTLWIQMAASLLIVISVVSSIWYQNTKQHTEVKMNTNTLPAAAQQFVQEYETEIADKIKHIDAGKIDSTAWREIQLELRLLENYGRDIRQDMNLYDQNQMIELLKRYYERKIRLIELLQKEMLNTEKKSENYES